MSPPLPAHRAVRSPAPTGTRAWRATAVTLAVALMLGLSAPQAQALSLGRITVQSALGEPLRAEIDIPQITADEIANLRTALGSPEAFRAAGMERSATLADLQISLQRRPNGTHFLRLSSDRVVNEPFIDLVLEASGPTGRIVREYTLLFDPPSLRQPPPSAPIAPQLSAPAPAPVPAEAPAPVAAAPSGPPPASPAAAAPEANAAPPAPPPPSPPAPAASAPPSARASAAAPGRKVTVQSGQTASAIAAANRPSTVSLDQMLVSLLRTNPDAFIGGNVNRLKAGAVLEVPTEAQAAAIGQPEARQTLVAQSKDFNEFKQRLAQGVTERAPTTTPAGRAASGRVEARVEDKKPAPAAPDKLTLSKGAVEEGPRDGKSAEDRIARERAQRDAAARAAEIDRNIADLKRLGTESAALTAPAASAASSPASGAAGLPMPAAVPTPAAEAASVPASAAASAPGAPASAPTTPASEAPGLAELLDDPLLPAAAGSVLALLLGWALYRRRRQPQGSATREEGASSPTAPDSFFGGSGGQHIDTAEAPSSMMYSPSQIDAAGDVDPVAEADVYLAYGRDLQAEEILREALRTTPQRVAIHAKLLEILARRNDVPAFEPLARDARALTGGTGPQWAQIASLGQELDPGNPLYTEAAPAPAPAPAERPVGGPVEAAVVSSPAPAPQVPPGLDLDIGSFAPAPVAAVPAEPAGSPFDFGEEPAPATPAAAADPNALDFDLAGLSLELDAPARDMAMPPAGEEALATKLSLAEEFQAIGDTDGARSLAQEVLAEASGDMRRRAERLLAELG